MDDMAKKAASAIAEGTDWPFAVIPPQRYKSNYARYLARGGPVRIGDLARRYTAGTDLPDPTRFFLFCHIFDQIVKEGLAGDLIEVGVYKGDTGILLAEMALKLGRTAYLCDTYEGFDAADLQGIDEGRSPLAFRDTSLQAVQARIGAANTVYVKGYFPASASNLPDAARFCMVHIDCDLYQPIIASLDYFYPRVVPGGFIVVHDYSSLGWDGAEKAVDDWFAERAESVVPIPDSSGSVVIRKVRSATGADGWRQGKKRVALDAWLSPANGGMATVLDHGWSTPEGWGVWGVGAEHTLSFSVPEAAPGTAYAIDLDVRAALVGNRTRQTVELSIGGHAAATLTFDTGANQKLWAVPVPVGAMPGGLVKLAFRPAATESVRDLEPSSKDTRRLGVALSRLRCRAA